MTRYLLILISALLAGPVLAEEGTAFFNLGGDVFRAGQAVSHEDAGADDLFMAGEKVTTRADVSGSAHLAGREVTLEGAVGGDAYLAGDNIHVTGSVAGDLTMIGRDLTAGDVSGDLRAAGQTVNLTGNIGGYAMIAGEHVTVNASVAGDVSLAAETVDWGEDTVIAGRLILYEEEPGEIDVPESVASADRVERREIDDWDGPQAPGWGRAILWFITGVIVVAALAALIAALVPGRLAEMRKQLLARPFRTLWLGFLAQSTVIGAAVLFAMTIIGLLLSPAMVMLALIGGFAGYVVSAYSFGVGLLLAFGTKEPDSIGDRALAAAVGALAAGVIGLIPFLGWLFVLALVLAGVGAITERVIRPVFFAAGDLKE